MELVVARHVAADLAILGDVFVDGASDYVSLERLGVQIPAGRYRVVLSISGRAMRGTLWSPDPEHRLPELLEVPGRSAIRIHSLNRPAETDGCIGVGLTRTGQTIGTSRVALRGLMARMANQVVWITVREATDAPPPRNV